MRKELSIDWSFFEREGNIYRLAEELKIQERKVLDFSATVNPLGVTKKIKAEIRKHLKYLHNYPDPDAKRLRNRLAQYHNIEPDTILCSNGSTELIYLIVRTLSPQRALIPVPTYPEYERAIRINQQLTSMNQSSDNRINVIKYLPLDKEKNFEISPEDFVTAIQVLKDSPETLSIAFLCNPNNPTGKALKKGDVLKIAEAARENKCYLVVDEAFIDFCPNESVIKETSLNPYLIVLRTLTNFYALAGLRIGYGVFPSNLIHLLREIKEPWSVNSLAQRAAAVAIKDKIFKKNTLELIQQEKRFLEKNFKRLGIEYFKSDVNFYLLKIDNAREICNHLIKKGILLKECSNFKGLESTYLRISVKSHRENSILIKELTSILDGHQRLLSNSKNADSD